MEKSLKLLFIACLMSVVKANVRVEIDFIKATNEVKKLPRFWTNTGFAPPEPVDKAADFFETDDVKRNLEIIGSLPNQGIRNVRIHWLLNLLSISNYSSTKNQQLPQFNFTRLDNFIWSLISDYHLYPTIEFMTTLKFRKINGIVWEDMAYQLVSRYIGRFGVKNVKKWKFETWNEPDLKGYNRDGFDLAGYNEYVDGISAGIKAAERQYSLQKQIKLRGPAGLFKEQSKHPFCWGVLERCNSDPEKCPIDVITFHRKGNGNDAEEIINGSFDLLRSFEQKFPNLTGLKFANTEADPIKKWSEPRDFQADTRYAASLVETVLQHWQAMFDGRMKNLDSISHDNSFLNFNPHFFTQRTLLARFQMNNTTPKHLQFIQKPVFSALGILSNLAKYAGVVEVIKDENLSYVITKNNRPARFYSCILLTSHVNLNKVAKKTHTFEVSLKNILVNGSDDELFYFVEGIDNKRTNPWMIYQQHGSPAFPDHNLLVKMRSVQSPMILAQPAKVFDEKILLNLQLTPPFVASIRICSKNVKKPKKIENLRLRKVNTEEILLFWSESAYHGRCIKTYEIFFKYSMDANFRRIEAGHIPFMYHQLKHTIPGCFRVRATDLFGRSGSLSNEICYDGA